MYCDDVIFVPSLKARVTQGTFAVGALDKERKNEGAIKVAGAKINHTLEGCNCPFCAEDILRSTCHHQTSNSGSNKARKSDSHFDSCREDISGLSRTAHYNPLENIIMSMSGIGIFLCQNHDKQ